MQGAIRAHRKRRAQLLLRVGDADRRDDHLVGDAALFHAQRLLQSYFIERVDRHLHPVRLHAGAVGFHPDTHIGIHDTFDAH